jgi:hypothetical protein
LSTKFGFRRPVAVVLPGLADVHVAPFVEGVRAEAGTLDRLEELLGDDGIGVDVGAVERRHQSFETNELFHLLLGRLLDGFATLFNVLADALHGVAGAAESRRQSAEKQKANFFMVNLLSFLK